MKRRDTLKLSIVAAATAALTGCGHSEIDKRRAHALAMFLLILEENYRGEAISDTPQNQLREKSLLRKVDPKIFDNMRAFLKKDLADTKDDAGNPAPALFHRKYRNIRLLMAQAANFKAGDTTTLGISLCADWPTAAMTSGRGDDPYSNPDECPCVDIAACPPVESLLSF
jgi:hypothetical protein